MKKIKYGLIFGSLIIFILGIACVILLASCNNLFDISADQPPYGYGRVTLNITDGETSRTLFPDTDSFDFTYTFYKKGETTGKVIQPEGGSSGNTVNFKLENGAYSRVEVEAGLGGAVVAGGTYTTEFTVSSSGNPKINVKLTPTPATGGKGTFEYKITYPAGTDLTITLKKWPSGSDELNVVSQASGTPNRIMNSTKDNLDAGSYVLAVTLKDNDNTNKSAGIVRAVHIYNATTTKFEHTFLENELISSATYGVTLSKNSDDSVLDNYTFASINDTDTDPPAALSVKVTNTGNKPTGELTVALSGTNAGSFTLTGSPISSIVVNGTGTFTVQPVKPDTGFTHGDYAATVTVSGGNGITASFDVSFKVLDSTVDTYSISLSKTGTFTFNEATFGYASTEETITVTNTGNKATGQLTAALSGTNAGTYFEIKDSPINSITTMNGTATFKVATKTGLDAGTYTATVTVSGGSGNTAVTASFNVSFTVNAKNVSNLTIDPIPDQTYTGSAITPTVTVKDGLTTLTLTTHYTVTYQNNIYIGETASVTVTGANNSNYTGARDVNFNILAPFKLTLPGNIEINLPTDTNQTLEFASAQTGYTPVDMTITVTNTGADVTDALTAALGAGNASSFTLSEDSIASIAKNGTGTFTVKPKAGLQAGTYEDTVTVKNAGDKYTLSFKVKFVVTEATYTVTFDKNDGSTGAGAVHATMTVTPPATTITNLPDPPTRTGYTFKGWYKNTEGTGEKFEATSEVTSTLRVYAKWEAEGPAYTYTVTFKLNDGTDTVYTTKTVTAPNTKIDALPTDPIRDGYTFDVWVMDDGKNTTFDASITINNNMYVLALWNENSTPATDLKIKVAGTDQEVVVTGEGGTIEYNNVHTGYTFTKTAGYGGSYAYFPVNFGTDKFNDFEKIKFTYQGVSGDIGSKQIYLIAKDTAFSGNISDTALIDATISDKKSIDGTTETNVELTITRTIATGFTNSPVYLSLYIHAGATGATGGAGSTTVFKISNIELVKATTAFTPVVVNTTIAGVTAPADGGTPKAAISTDEYTGAINWTGALNNGKFVASTVYTAEITLTKKPGYTFNGISANAFSVEGATTTTNPLGNTDNTIVVTAVFPPATGAAAPVEVWTPTITTTTSLSNAEYIGNTGIKRDSGASDLSFGVIDGGFTVTNTGTYKQFCVQVGTGAGGSDYYYTAWNPACAAGNDYTVTFMASVETGTGQIRINGNGAPGGSDPWAKTQDLTDTPTQVTYSWVQGSGNLKFDTGNSVAGTVITITGIRITTP